MKLYILDDDQVELAMWAGVIQRTNPEIEFRLFSDCSKFQAAVLKSRPDLCVIDFVMPYHPGTEVCEWLHIHAPSTKVFICTGLDGDQYKVLAEACHANYLHKSMKFNDRLEVVCNGC